MSTFNVLAYYWHKNVANTGMGMFGCQTLLQKVCKYNKGARSYVWASRCKVSEASFATKKRVIKA
jgi:hypothetical protein